MDSVMGLIAYVGRDAFMGSWSYVICDCTAILLPVFLVAAIRGRISWWTLAWLVDVAFAHVLVATPDIVSWYTRIGGGRIPWSRVLERIVSWAIMAILAFVASSLWVRSSGHEPPCCGRE